MVFGVVYLIFGYVYLVCGDMYLVLGSVYLKKLKQLNLDWCCVVFPESVVDLINLTRLDFWFWKKMEIYYPEIGNETIIDLSKYNRYQ